MNEEFRDAQINNHYNTPEDEIEDSPVEEDEDDRAIDAYEMDRLMARIEPKPLKNDSLLNRGNPNSRYYDGI